MLVFSDFLLCIDMVVLINNLLSSNLKCTKKLLIMVKRKKKALMFTTSPKILHVFYPKWTHSPVEPAHNRQNQEIIWFPHYNVIHRPTSTFSSVPVVWIYLFSHPHLVFVWSVTKIFGHLDNLGGLKADKVNMRSEWPFLYGIFFTKNVCNVYSCCNMYQYYILFSHCN